MPRTLKWAAAAVALVAWATPAAAQTNAELMQELQKLRNRVDELEKKDTTANKESLLAALKEYEGDAGMKVFWKEGLRLESHDGWFKLKIGGRVQFDMGYTSDDDDANLENQEDWAEFRRLRMYMQGVIYENVGYKVQIDFADADVSLKDAYMTIHSDGFKNVENFLDVFIAGHFKEPFGLEELTSSKYITFIERSNPIGLLAPSRNLGIAVSKYWSDHQLGYAVGVFREANNNDGESVSDGGYHLTGRVTWAPLYQDKGQKLIHLGAAYSLRHYGSDEGSPRYRTRGEQHIGNRFLDTTALAADDVDLFGAEAAMVWGPFSLQGEFLGASVESTAPGVDDICLTGAYVQASYFLTGEYRPYKNGTFSRVKPKKNFSPDGGTGAVELAARYSYLDMTDGNFNTIAGGRAGQVDAMTIGVNWYLNPNTRIMVNYVRSCWDVDANTADGTSSWDESVDTVMLRFQVDF
ncbi:MAG: OprO/OprP family phosphate-selective porin [Phycisphaerae bacterium]